MKLNTNKCHLLVSGNKNEYMKARLDQNIFWESNDVKLFEVAKDNNLRFHNHGSIIC